jgi:hypothetical protein
MLRFPYRRIGVKPLPALTRRPSWLVHLFRALIGKPAPEERDPSSPSRSAADDPPRPFVSVRIKGPAAARRLKSALLDTGSLDTLFPAELAAPLGIVLGGERRAIRWRGQRHEVEFHTVELELAEGVNVLRWKAWNGVILSFYESQASVTPISSVRIKRLTQGDPRQVRCPTRP